MTQNVPAQSAGSLPYQTPPPAIVDIIDAPPTPAVYVDPTHTWLLIMDRPNLMPIDELAQPELRLAGLRINPRTFTASRRGFYSGLTLKSIRTGDEKPVTGLPDDARIQHVDWSPDARHLAFSVLQNDELTLWLAAMDTARARRLGEFILNSTYGTPFQWVSDNQTLICKLRPAQPVEIPAEPLVPAGPVIQETTGRKAPARTYQDLLQNPHDEALFEIYTTTQLAAVNLTGEVTALGKPAIYAGFDPSPDGLYILVQTIHRPFSYTVPLSRFPRRAEIWDRSGRVVHLIADLPLAEYVPIAFDAVPTGPRSVSWRADAPATVYWVEAQDQGDPKTEAKVRDKMFALTAPFTEESRELLALEMRFGGVLWGRDDLALVNEWWWKTRRIRSWRFAPGADDVNRTLMFDRSLEDRYNDPGSPLLRRNEAGQAVLLTTDEGQTLFLRGAGASPEGDRPFLDILSLADMKTRRLWRSEAPYYEQVVRLLDPEKLVALTQRESVTEPPNFFLRHLKGESLTQVTAFPHPTPQLKDVQKEMIHYERADGVNLTATLYLPPGYDPAVEGPLPLLMWAYPQEFKSADAAGQVTDSPHRFIRVGWWSPIIWVAAGYAVLDDPAIPIVGEAKEEPNDTFIRQLQQGAAAAVEEVVRRGVARKGHMAVGGHSYGAFMTANLLAHTDLFAAGIARSGAYNRTLTPFGFQAEERNFWEAPDVYFAMSPFMHAHQINEPLLLIHGEADNNSGTFPMQSERLYDAVKGLGGTARLVMLPHESHGYLARESIMHMLWETWQWLEKYVRPAVE
ncbi:MAG: prolyl oligopeptidase family serine peptidase [Acidobacteria bacterium]|nr:prolyl oligopeptidase family serine peptidase [Acidobacteriota bacterium]